MHQTCLAAQSRLTVATMPVTGCRYRVPDLELPSPRPSGLAGS
jgi:hypothetical protein